MDLPRVGITRQRIIKGIIFACLTLCAMAGGIWFISRLKPADPPVDRASVWIDTVKRGPMLRQIRGLGALVPEDIRWVAAATEGRVERKLIQPGAHVSSDTILLELSNAQLQQETLNAEWEWKAAKTSAKFSIPMRLRPMPFRA